jgi:DNA-binding MarR family transcriptional regulator
VSANEANEPNVLPRSLIDNLPFVLSKVGMYAKRDFEQHLGADGFTFRHHAVLASLAEFGAMTQRDISQRMHCDASDMVDIVDHLESRGFISRERNTQDRRRYDVTITNAGQKELQRQLAVSEQLTAEFFDGMSKRDREMLHDLLLRVFAIHDERVPRP